MNDGRETILTPIMAVIIGTLTFVILDYWIHEREKEVEKVGKQLIEINRKLLYDLSGYRADVFNTLVKIAKGNLVCTQDTQNGENEIDIKDCSTGNIVINGKISKAHLTENIVMLHLKSFEGVGDLYKVAAKDTIVVIKTYRDDEFEVRIRNKPMYVNQLKLEPGFDIYFNTVLPPQPTDFTFSSRGEIKTKDSTIHQETTFYKLPTQKITEINSWDIRFKVGGARTTIKARLGETTINTVFLY